MRTAFANVDDDDGGGDGAVAGAFRDVVEDPPWRALADADGLVAWRADRAAHDEAGRLGVRLWGADAGVVARVADAAFSARIARTIDAPFTDYVVDLDADRMSTSTIETTVAKWPSWARDRFALVDRRGQRVVVGKDGRFRFENVEGLTIFRRHNGGVVMPWPERVVEITTCFIVDAHGEPHHLGAARVRAHDGSVLGSAGLDVVAGAGGLGAGTDFDDAALDRARVVVEAAARDGYRGPLAVDAFTWMHKGDVRLRGLAWLHARFTRAHIALALVARERPRPGARFHVVDDVVEELPS